MAPEIPQTMKAIQLVEYKKPYQLNNVPVPKIGENDLLVKIAAAGFCHTDYQVWEGVYGSPTPLIGSHEPVGTIVSVGSKAQNKWKVGQRIGASLFRHACHTCWGCKNYGDDIRQCQTKETAGLFNDGGFAEYMVADAETTVLLPDSISFEQAAPLMCAGLTVWEAMQRCELGNGEPIGVIGVGGLGSLAVQFAKAAGHPVVAIDNRAEGRELATDMTLKADLVVDPADPNALSKIKDWAGEGGLVATIICNDDVSVAEWSLKLLRPFGKTVPLGLPPGGLKFDAFDLVFQNLSIIGSLVGTTEGLRKVMETASKFNIHSYVTTYPIEDVVNFPDIYGGGHVKGRLVMKIE
ncbi:putative alcohol dehydrogenase [Periconia macrospinosa]|uniref:Putative alcohol dehydrogenase n=1 Tax=Periconia macrospinosa TaxID=97972 RepID=A0A2V1D617_9PLEO|nr:putative alcohol dehydrogenase [Periconia macrospinosa]